MLENRFRWHFLSHVMVGIHARNVPLSMANRNRVDDKPENAFMVTASSKVNECIFGPEKKTL